MNVYVAIGDPVGAPIEMDLLSIVVVADSWERAYELAWAEIQAKADYYAADEWNKENQETRDWLWGNLKVLDVGQESVQLKWHTG